MCDSSHISEEELTIFYLSQISSPGCASIDKASVGNSNSLLQEV